ncbi:MAG: 50S ribosomal protein L15 [Betaproteobacteria bacterium]|nr:50S ribosomal protein L15 [Betaproteobacteria bacterium]
MSDLLRLNRLAANPGSSRRSKRVGRGTGSGRGKTAGRGHKGQLSRAGKFGSPGFEGGQMPLQRRLPKRGFRSRRAPTWLRLPLSMLDTLPEAADREVDIELLRERGMVASNKKQVKIYLSGRVQRAHVLRGIAATAGAAAAIKAAGGKVEPVAAPAPKEAG